MTTLSSQQDYRDLDSAFQLPEVIGEPWLRELYEVLVARMRAEAAALPLNTMQQLLIERIAFNYVTMRWNEIRNSFRHTSAQKEYNTFWMTMVKEFNAQLRSQADDTFRATVLAQVGDAINRVLAEEDPATAKLLKAKFAAALSEQGL